MRKKLLIVAALAITASAGAATLGPDRALARALSQGGAGIQKKPTTSYQLVRTGEYQGRNSYYIFSNDASAMVVSAEEIAVPVIGYLDRPIAPGTQIPPQMEWWLEEYGREVQYALDHPSNGSLAGKVISDRQKAAKAPKNAIQPLLSTTWNQGAPYDKYTPEISGQKTPTGCVATAMAQVMKYYNYPEKGTGSLSYDWGGANYSLNLDDYPLKWDEMLNSYPYSTSGTEEQRDAVARLMQCVGYSVKMQYAPGGSGAYPSDIAPALINNFKYDRSAYLDYKEYYSPDDWADKLYTELAAQRPLIYGGRGDGGGHQFVCDGYREDDYFHFNWGWGGSCDGYFSLSYLVPEVMGTGGNNDGFTSDQHVIFNVMKPVAGSKPAEAWLSVYQGKMIGEYSNGEIILKTDNNNGFICINNSSEVYNGNLGYAIVGANGEPTNTVLWSTNLLSRYGYWTLECSLPSDLSDGTYKIYPIYTNSNGEWVPVRVRYGDPESVFFSVNNGNVTILDSEPEVTELEFSNLNLPEYVVPGENYSFTVDVKNNTSEDITVELAGPLCAVSGNQPNIASDYSLETFTFPAGEQTNITLTGTAYSNLNQDDYYYILGVVDSDGKLKIYNEVEVRELEYTVEYTISDLPEYVVPGENYSFKVDVKNNTSEDITVELAGPLCAVIEGAAYNYSESPFKMFTFPAGEKTTITLTGTAHSDVAQYTCNYILGVVDREGHLKIYDEVEVRDLEYTVSDLPEYVVAGKEYKFTVEVSNPASGDVSIELAGIFGRVDGDKYYANSSYSFQTINLQAGESKTIILSGTADSNLEPENYNYFLATIIKDGYFKTFDEIQAYNEDPGTGDDIELTAMFDFNDIEQLLPLSNNADIHPSGSVSNQGTSAASQTTNNLNGVTFTNESVMLKVESNGSDAPMWWSNSDDSAELRFNGGNKLNVTVDGGSISSITFAAGAETGLYTDDNYSVTPAGGIWSTYSDGTKEWIPKDETGVTEFSFIPAKGDKSAAKKITVVYKKPTGIVEVTDNAEPEYYTLQGIRVNKPSHGLYIVRKGNKSHKVMIP